MFQLLVLVVHETAADGLRGPCLFQRGRPGGTGMYPGRSDSDLFGIGPAQGEFIAPEGDLQWISQGRDFGDGDLGSWGQAHIDQAPFYGTGCIADGQDGSALPGGERFQCPLIGIH